MCSSYDILLISSACEIKHKKSLKTTELHKVHPGFDAEHCHANHGCNMIKET